VVDDLAESDEFIPLAPHRPRRRRAGAESGRPRSGDAGESPRLERVPDRRTRQIETRRHRFLVEAANGVVHRHRFTTRRRYWHAAQLRAASERYGLEVERMCEGYAGRVASGDREQLVFVLR
jgi:hypothetical protein